MEGVAIIGLIVSLIGSYKLYRSIIPITTSLMAEEGKKAYPKAVLNSALSREGMRLVFIGICVQLLSLLLPPILRFVLFLKCSR